MESGSVSLNCYVIRNNGEKEKLSTGLHLDP
jgi:hypothetical protein